MGSVQRHYKHADDNITICFTKKFIGMKNYVISYTTNVGVFSLPCYSWEVGGILKSLVAFALRGFALSNVTIKSV